ncbi:MAG: GNAT family N-acetyltransferase [Chloroflexi bacterium]|nr:GNAT family N-acetyltransferase [Chloroflexota bacterium]
MITKEKQHKLKEGFTYRSPKMEDVEATVELFNVCSINMIGKPEFTVKEMALDWQTPGYNMETDHRAVFSPQGQLIGYLQLWAVSDVPVQPYAWGNVHPDFEGFGIGSFLLKWGESRARQVFDKVPDNARVVLVANALDSYAPAKNLLKSSGMYLTRHAFQMRIEMDDKPPEPEWPQGITVRTYNPKEDAEAFYRADDEAFKDHFGHVEEPFESGFKLFMHYFTNDETYDPELWFMAMDADEIAGVSLGRKWSYEDKEVGWVSSFGVRRPWRKRGIALALLQHSFREFWERGQRKVGLGVDALNLTGALRLYEKAGMYVHRKYNRYEKVLREGDDLSTTSIEE